MSGVMPPAEWKGKFVSTLQGLLFMRDQHSRGVTPEIFFGSFDARRFRAFVEGCHFHLFCCGAPDGGYAEFFTWLRDIKKEHPSPEGWDVQLLAGSEADQRAAVLKFLERCAEFVALRQSSPQSPRDDESSWINPPAAWKGTFVRTLDVVLFMREQILAGVSPESFIGRMDVRALDSFVDGMHFHIYCCGAPDEGYMRLIDWLRDVKGEFPDGVGWTGLYLAEFNGDHRAAIMKFLDRCAEFMVTRTEPG